MFWIRSGLHAISISDWLTAGPSVAADPSSALEDARDAMLGALGFENARKCVGLAMKIRGAADIRALWALRPELMTAISHVYGESEGRKRLAAATVPFESVLPEACALTTPRRGHAMQRRI